MAGIIPNQFNAILNKLTPAEYSITMTVSGGTATHDTAIEFSHYLKHLLIKPTTSTTSYTINISTSDGISIYSSVRTGNFGMIPTGDGIPLIGVITIDLTSVSANEDIKVKLVYM